MYFLNVGIDACVSNCRSRLWEPDKYESKAAQDGNLEMLIKWVREYERRDDDCSLQFHRQIFEAFEGTKYEFTSNAPAAEQGRGQLD